MTMGGPPVRDADTRVVSVVIPCYNYARYLRGCVESVLSQEGVTPRILIIDDASPDDTAQVCEQLAREHPAVSFRRHAHNQGHIATYNEGLLEWADGDYVTLLSADDLLTGGSLLRSVRIMEEHPSVGLVYGRSLDMPDDAPPRVTGRHRGALVTDGDVWLARRCRETVNVVPTPGTVLRTGIQHRAGGYDPALPHAGDFEMWLRVAAITDIGYVRGVPQGLYRVHRASMSQHVYQDRLADVLQRKVVFDCFFDKCRGAVARAGVDVARTYATLASHPLWLACRAIEKGEVSVFPMVEAEDLARNFFPEVESLRAYRALSRRRRLGEKLCHRTQLFIGTAVGRRLMNMWWWERWKRYGG